MDIVNFLVEKMTSVTFYHVESDYIETIEANLENLFAEMPLKIYLPCKGSLEQENSTGSRCCHGKVSEIRFVYKNFRVKYTVEVLN